MSPTPAGCFRKPTPYPPRPTNRRPPRARRRPRFRSGLALSVVLHVIVLGSLVNVAGLTPAPGRFDVFAADPVDAAPEHAVVQSPPEPLRPMPIVNPPKARLPQPDRSPVLSARAPARAPSRGVSSAKSALPQDPPLAPIGAVAASPTELAAVAVVPPSPPDAPLHPSRTDPIAGVPVSVPSVAPTHTELLSSPAANEVEDEGPLGPRWAPESFAAVEPPTAPSIASMALHPAAPRADVLRPVPAMPLTVAAAAP